MKGIVQLVALGVCLGLAIGGCGPSPTAAVPEVTRPTASTALAPPSLAPTEIPVGTTITVDSTDDSGPGTLRQALSDAQAGDTILFDPAAFPPEAPETIVLLSGLPPIGQGHLTVDASDAGIILDGSQAGGDWTAGILVDSQHNVVRGLQSEHFTGPGLLLTEHANFNTIGGERGSGAGPLGQGNLFSDDSDGIAVKGSYNVISGNLVGTDASGVLPLGNRAPGIFFEENASQNVIGPDNIIAFNGTRGEWSGGGVEIRGPNTAANVITANAIHDNSAAGIYFNVEDRSKASIPEPALILGFDLASGTASGIACPACIVEIFSTASDQGDLYEGSVVADQDGGFWLSKGSAFTGPFLTATSTPEGSNTSEFASPTSGPERSATVQANNHAAPTRLVPKPANELKDNRIGQLYDKLYLLGDLQGNLRNEIVALGTKYVKLTITEAEAETNLGGQKEPVAWDVSEFSFQPEDEAFITGMADNGIAVDYLLNFWDKANHPSGWQPSVSRFRNQEEIDHYLEYVRFVATHFRDRLHYYEIWNEPNNRTPLQWIQPADYINLVRQAVPVIRAADPQAQIVVGSVARPADPTAHAYLFDILNSDIMPLVDVVAWHPFYGVSPAHDSGTYFAYPAMVQQIKETASAHGFEGAYRADELLYRSPDCTWCDPGDPLDSNQVAAKYYARAVILNLGMDIGAGVAGMSSSRGASFAAIQNLCSLMDGAQAADKAVDIEGNPGDIRHYGFSLPDDETLIAVWVDGVAVDEDPGVPMTITLPGFAGYSATAVDILEGFQQALVHSGEGGSLVIRDLMVKDYPLLIRLSPQ